MKQPEPSWHFFLQKNDHGGVVLHGGDEGMVGNTSARA